MHDAIAFQKEPSLIKTIDVGFESGGLAAADEVARQSDSCDGQREAAGDEKVDGAEPDGIALTPIHNFVQVGGIWMERILRVALETLTPEEIVTQVTDSACERHVGAAVIKDFISPLIPECAICIPVFQGVTRFDEHADSGFQIEIFTRMSAEVEESEICGFSLKMFDDGAAS